MTRRSQHYPPELRERAVRMVAEVTPNYDSQWAAIGAVAQKLGVGTAETVRKWVRQAEVDAGQRPGATSDESAEIKRLKREVAELRRANEILKAASASSRPSSTGRLRAREVHRRARRPHRRWAAMGCRADLQSAVRARLPDRPVALLRRPHQRRAALSAGAARCAAQR